MQLAQHFPHIDVVSVPGNHGRMTKKPSYKNRIENFDMIMTDMLSMILANQPNITITASPAFATIVEVENHSIFLSHGDTVRGWQGIPYYGFNRMRGNVREMMAFRGDKVDVFCHGHFHQAGYLAGPMILNGCMSGPDEFSVTNAMGVDHPHQMMFGMHAEQGMSSMYKLRLDKAEEQFPNPSFIYDPEIQVQEQVRALMDR
jgi:calcineurin-like phosphoesterase family protein